MTSASRDLIKIEQRGDVSLATILEPRIIGEEEIQDLGIQLFRLVEQEKRHQLILDFQHVESLSSAALAKLFSLKKKLGAVHGTLRLCGIRPDLLEVFRITRLDTVFEITRDVPAALARF